MEEIDQQYLITCPHCGVLPSVTRIATGANGNLWSLDCFEQRDERHDVTIRPRPPGDTVGPEVSARTP